MGKLGYADESGDRPEVRSARVSKAAEMYYDPSVTRPDITYFNVGAIGPT